MYQSLGMPNKQLSQSLLYLVSLDTTLWYRDTIVILSIPAISPIGSYRDRPEHLEMVKHALKLMGHASRLHYALYENPTDKQIHELQHLEDAHLLLEKVASGQVAKVVEGSGNISKKNFTLCILHFAS